MLWIVGDRQGCEDSEMFGFLARTDSRNCTPTPNAHCLPEANWKNKRIGAGSVIQWTHIGFSRHP